MNVETVAVLGLDEVLDPFKPLAVGRVRASVSQDANDEGWNESAASDVCLTIPLLRVAPFRFVNETVWSDLIVLDPHQAGRTEPPKLPRLTAALLEQAWESASAILTAQGENVPTLLETAAKNVDAWKSKPTILTDLTFEADEYHRSKSPH